MARSQSRHPLPLPFVVEPMEAADVAQVMEIEREAFVSAWPAEAFLKELKENRLARYLVVRHKGPDGKGHGPLLGYAGLWIIVDEAHLTTIAVRHTHRGLGLGELLLLYAIRLVAARGATAVTLEVRASNTAAQELYRKYGFKGVGRRRGYYRETREDAILMTVEGITTRSYQAKLDKLEMKLAEKLLVGNPQLPDRSSIGGPRVTSPKPSLPSRLPQHSAGADNHS